MKDGKYIFHVPQQFNSFFCEWLSTYGEFKKAIVSGWDQEYFRVILRYGAVEVYRGDYDVYQRPKYREYTHIEWSPSTEAL